MAQQQCCRPPCVVAVLVDEAVWPWRGGLWAHLVSDESIAELHDFAERLGLRRMAFQGDHYDVPSEVRERALQIGAQAVGGRDLVQRLRAADLRLPASERPGRWESIAAWETTGSPPDLSDWVPERLVEAFDRCVQADWSTATVTLYRRQSETVVLVNGGDPPRITDLVPDGVEWRCTEDRVLELIIQEDNR